NLNKKNINCLKQYAKIENFSISNICKKFNEVYKND
ncbi:unnamed protein product, partial [marine sediment metagenome]